MLNSKESDLPVFGKDLRITAWSNLQLVWKFYLGPLLSPVSLRKKKKKKPTRERSGCLFL
jgi:hypothetical protein